MKTTTGWACIVLALVTACAPADSSGSPRATSKAPTSSSVPARPVAPYQVPAVEMHGIRVEYDDDSTTVTTRGERHRLPGRFTFDALSPDKRWLYLIEHRPPAGSEHYRVRLLDLRSGRLRAQAIADKVNLETDMSGLPMARATTSDGTWVFTLYRGEKHAFVHALNTRDSFARCLDLPHGSGEGAGVWRLELNEDSRELSAVAGSPQDTATFDLAGLVADESA